MTEVEAHDWLERVGARVLHHPEKEGSDHAWALLVCMPPASNGRSRIILTFGKSLTAAASAAEARWDEVWEGLSSVH